MGGCHERPQDFYHWKELQLAALVPRLRSLQLRMGSSRLGQAQNPFGSDRQSDAGEGVAGSKKVIRRLAHSILRDSQAPDKLLCFKYGRVLFDFFLATRFQLVLYGINHRFRIECFSGFAFIQKAISDYQAVFHVHMAGRQ